MALSNQFLVPGTSKVWVSAPHGTTGDPTTWIALPHTVTWEFTANVEEATELRTSDTNDQKIAACGGATSYEATMTSALCNADWLYAYILDDEEVATSGSTLWFYCCHNATAVPQGITSDSIAPADMAAIRGPLFKGQVQAPGIEFDNDASEPTVVEWTVKIQEGPYLPISSSTTTPRPLSSLGL